MTRIKPIVWLLISIPWILLACALPMHKMQQAFVESLGKTVGRTHDELTCCPGRFLYGLEPTETKYKDNGNLLREYIDFWGPHVKRMGTCNIFLEFDSDTMRVVEASAEGPGCYRAY